MAEIELNVLTGQCLNRRIDDIEFVRKDLLHGKNTETIKMRKLIDNLQLRMQGLNYLDFIRHLMIDLTRVLIWHVAKLLPGSLDLYFLNFFHTNQPDIAVFQHFNGIVYIVNPDY